ncbi:3-dehydroquinate synthase [Aestuariibacter sp. AA17]|uniref:3-dehydroquinate synthase n=1 Tax=Fluctibacter corallii TaxID=2984329 RepID=A0ABT3A6Y1_9ALTE|nr:3-dehydroquinate synthase [Aestuariibacter sp. AA17]MCV2884375.1 3-dehydroquinate synthase [Aestuariibacter sp. AA17]
MSTVNVELGERSYPITIGSSLLSNPGHVGGAITTSKVVVVTNDTIAPLYIKPLLDALVSFDTQVITINDGEAFKTLATFDLVISQLLDMHAGRDTTLIALGGGVVGDLCGFVAACYQRGIPFIQVPTTLLSQVDSSVGGKTAVNHPKGKNMIGAFYQPNAVFIDIDTLSTLPAREFSAGMAEVIKYGIIYDKDFFEWLEANHQALRQLSPEALQYAITRCCEIKAEIVAKDERESGIRALLNLGHTFGHAIETEMGYGTWLHGEAVATGMLLASLIAESKGWLTASEVCRVKALLETFSLPVTVPKNMSLHTFMQHMQHDKKVQAGKIRFIIPNSLGSAVVTDEVDESEINKAIGECR